MVEVALESLASGLMVMPPDTGRAVVKPSAPKPFGVKTPPNTSPTDPVKLKEIDAAWPRSGAMSTAHSNPAPRPIMVRTVFRLLLVILFPPGRDKRQLK